MDKIDNKTPPNVPTLRFKEFADFWQQRTFNETFDILTNNTLSRAELNYEDGEYKNIHYGDVLIKFSAFTDVSSADVPYINDDSVPTKLCSTLLQNGDIVLADTAEDYTVGKATEVENIFENKVVSGLHTIPCRPKMRFSPRYLGYYVNSPKYHNQLIPFIQGVKVSSISKSLIKNTFISYPSLSEQSKIASFLSCLDEKIATQNKIISKYESLIKGIEDSVLSVFESVEYQLGDLVQIVKGHQINGLQLELTGDYYYLNGGISPSGYVNKYNTEENTISISEGGNSCGFVRFNTEKFWSGGHCYTLKIKDAFCCVKYLFYYLKSNEKDIMQLRVGSGLPNIQKGSLAGFPVKLPRLQMQQSIVRVLDALTNKKEIEIALLKQLQSQKTYLLSKMFI